MTSLPQYFGSERAGNPAVRICVPTGFFERLMEACDFRAISKQAFSRYNPRPSSSKADPSLFFRILLLEYIFDVSSEVLRNEFSSHPGLRAFLEIEANPSLPQPEEIVLFRVKLGWLGFKKVLDAVIREAKKNRLTEADCSILEKRYPNPLIIPFSDEDSTPPAESPQRVHEDRPNLKLTSENEGFSQTQAHAKLSRSQPTSPVAQVRPDNFPWNGLGEQFPSEVPARPRPRNIQPDLISARLQPTAPKFKSAAVPSPEPRASAPEFSKRISIDPRPAYVESTLRDTAKMIWASQIPREISPATLSKPDPKQPDPSTPSVPPMVQHGPEPGPTPEPSRETNPCPESIEKKVVAADAQSPEISVTGKPQPTPTAKPEPARSFGRDVEGDPLGIDLYFDKMGWSATNREEWRKRTERKPAVKSPPVRPLSAQSFTVSSAPSVPRDVYTLANIAESSVSEPEDVQSLDQRDWSDSVEESSHPECENRDSEPPTPSLQTPSDGSLNLKPEDQENQEALPLAPPIEEKATVQVGQAAQQSDQKDFFAGEPGGESETSLERPPEHWGTGGEWKTSDPVNHTSPEVLPTLSGGTPKKSVFSVQFFTRLLYVAVPLLIVFAVYVLIVFLKSAQPSQSAVEPDVAHAASATSAPEAKHEEPSPMPSQQPFTSSQTPANTAPAGQPGGFVTQKASPEKTRTKLAHSGDTKTSSETASPEGQTLKTESTVPPRSKSSNPEGTKKEALLLYLRQVYHLDLQPDQYTYEELKDINNRLEREAKKPLPPQ